MCTMTWFVKEQGYELFFNRDERLSRRRAELPSLQSSAGVDYIAPTDTDAGGTWIAVNQFGITVCLLNHYQFEQIETYQKWVSRGEVVRQFANIRDIDQVEAHFNALSLPDYRAFRLFVIDLNGENRLCVWDSHKPRVEYNVSTPKSSSSVSSQHVKQTRKQHFIDSGLMGSQNTAKFQQFHASHHPYKSEQSVCMHRADAKTVSFSHITVSSTQASFAYADGAPCEAALGKPFVLSLDNAFDELGVLSA